MRRRGLVLFAHGARDPEWAVPFADVRDRVARHRPDVVVELAFLEIMTPRLAEAVERLAASGIEDVTVAPLFMAPGGHLKHDVPRLLAQARERHPGLCVRLLPAVGEVDAIREAVAAWLRDAVPSDR